MNRFSKATLARTLMHTIKMHDETYKFNEHDGWAQVDGKGEETNRAYGEWNYAHTLMDLFELGKFLEEGK